MFYLEKTPSAVLAPWVRSLWYCKAPGVAYGRERVLPNGCIQIVLNLCGESLTDCGDDGAASERLARAIVVGARGRYEVIDTSDLAEVAGIVIRPGAFARLFRERADLFFEQSISLESVWREPVVDGLCEVSSPAEKLCRLERLLIGLVRQDTCRSEMVDHAIYLFHRNILAWRSVRVRLE